MFDCGEDRGLVLQDPALQLDEGFDAAAAGPADPFVEGHGRVGGVETEDRPESFFEEVGPMESGVGLGDPGEFGLLPGSEVLRVLPQCVAGSFEGFGVAAGPSGPALGDRAAGGVPGLAADLVERFGGPFEMWNGSAKRTAEGQCFSTTALIQSAPSALTWLIWAQRPSPEASTASKNDLRVALSRPGAAHTNRPESWSTTTVYLWPRLSEISSIPIRRSLVNRSCSCSTSAQTRLIIAPT